MFVQDIYAFECCADQRIGKILSRTSEFIGKKATENDA